MLNDEDKFELNKKKQLQDFIESLDRIILFLNCFQKNKNKIMPMIDGFDLEHNKTYIELTKDMRSNLNFIRNSCYTASSQLSKYRKLANPNYVSSSDKLKNNIKAIQQRTEARIKKTQADLDDLEAKQKQRESAEEYPLVNLSTAEFKAKLDKADKIKRERIAKRTKRIENIESNILRLKWAGGLIFILQLAILVLIAR